MDKNTVIGFLLIIAVIIGFSYFNRPSEEQIRQQRTQDSISAVQQKQAEQTNKNIASANAETLNAEKDSDGIFVANKEKSRLVFLKNNEITIGINTQGGVIGQVVLKTTKGRTRNPFNFTATSMPIWRLQ